MAVEDDADTAWLERLKAAYEARYYQTEAAEDEQTRFPWQNRTCGDCPFWVHAICLVDGQPRPANAHTCRYFDRAHREEARRLIQRQRWALLRRLP